MSAPTFAQNVTEHIRAGHQVLLVRSYEEIRVENDLKRVAADRDMDFVTWNHVDGFSTTADHHNPVEALQRLTQPKGFPRDTLVVFRDLHNFYDSPDVRRQLRTVASQTLLNNDKFRRPLVLIQPSPRLHPDLTASVTEIEYQLPTPVQLGEAVDHVGLAIKNPAKRACPPELRYAIVQALRGLTAAEASDCLSLCLVRHGGYDPAMVETIERVKAATLKRTEVLTYVPREQIPDVANLGGYDELIDFVRQRALAYTQQAAEVRLDNPKGIILLGVPGAGKSVAAMAIARTLNLPLLEFDFSAIFNSLVGASEARLREVIALVSAIDGCVLVVDEADKSLGNSLESSGDSGVTRRLFGMFLTWLARKTDRTFVVMTMNRTKGMPPELLRKGRFDEIFYVDLPTEDERRKILRIHMELRAVDPGFYSAAEWKGFMKASADFVGAEIEESVKSARFAAFQLAHVRRLIDEHRASTGAAKAKVDADLKAYPDDLKTRAVDLSAAELAHMARGVPAAAQVVAAMKAVDVTKLTRVDRASIEEIREFGTKRGRPVSADRRKSTGARVVDTDGTN